MVSKSKLLVLALLVLASAVAFGQAISGDIIGTTSFSKQNGTDTPLAFDSM